jgi:hypothetical protein
MARCDSSVGGMITFIDGKNISLKFWFCGLTNWENVGEKICKDFLRSKSKNSYWCMKIKAYLHVWFQSAILQ